MNWLAVIGCYLLEKIQQLATINHQLLKDGLNNNLNRYLLPGGLSQKIVCLSLDMLL